MSKRNNDFVINNIIKDIREKDPYIYFVINNKKLRPIKLRQLTYEKFVSAFIARFFLFPPISKKEFEHFLNSDEFTNLITIVDSYD